MLYLFALLFGVACAYTEWDREFRRGCLENLDTHGAFQSWRADWEKIYDTVDDELYRYGVWLANLEKIADYNSEEYSFKLKMNQFGDLTEEEFREQMKCLLPGNSKPIGNDEAHRHMKGGEVEANPSTVDWTTQGVVTPVKNQGQCGSCWAFSTTGSLECDYAIKTGTLTSLSEQQLVDCSGSYGNYGCNGGWYYSAWDYAKDNGGLCTESSYPYTARDGTCKSTTCGAFYDAPNGYTKVTVDSDSALETAAAEGCVSVAIEADQFAFQYYSSGVLTGTCGTSIDHAVLVVGYGTQGGQEYWKVKNSWGTSWGEAGYVLICRNCGANGNEGECGINLYPMFPTFA